MLQVQSFEPKNRNTRQMYDSHVALTLRAAVLLSACVDNAYVHTSTPRSGQTAAPTKRGGGRALPNAHGETAMDRRRMLPQDPSMDQWV